LSDESNVPESSRFSPFIPVKTETVPVSLGTPARECFGLGEVAQHRAKTKGLVAKRTDTKIAVLVQVMEELGFDRETIAKVCHVPLRTVADIVNLRGLLGLYGEFNETRETVPGSP